MYEDESTHETSPKARPGTTASLSSADRQLVSIYKSIKTDEMYLYVMKSDAFKRVPEALIAQLGQTQHVMDLLLTPQKKLARVEVVKVMQALSQQGFYLQMPPPKENLLQPKSDQ